MMTRILIVNNYSNFFYSGRLPTSSELLTKEDVVKVKRCLYALQRDGLPPITTHNVVSQRQLKFNNFVFQELHRTNR